MQEVIGKAFNSTKTAGACVVDAGSTAASACNQMVMGEPEDPEAAEARKNREAIVQGLLRGRVSWADNFCQDLWFYMKQNHVVVGLFFCHKLHPYSRQERFLVYAATLLASFGLTMAMLDPKTGGKHDGIGARAAGLTVSIIVSILTVIATQALICPCCQEGACCYAERAKSGAEGLGRCIACTCIFFALVFFCGGWALGASRDVPHKLALTVFLYSQAYSFAIGLALALVMFLVSYWGVPCCSCCCPAQAGLKGAKEGAAFPHGPEYPRDWSLFHGGDRGGCCSEKPPSMEMSPSVGSSAC